MDSQLGSQQDGAKNAPHNGFKPVQNAEQTIEIKADQLFTIMTTEHYTLQMGRSNTISESSGRSSLFLSSLSGVLVALGFVATATKMDSTFFLFALVLLVPLIFLGIATFIRTLQNSIQDMLYVHNINKIRRFYVEAVPAVKDYVMVSASEQTIGITPDEGFMSPRFQTFFTNAGTISVINSVIAGVIVGLAVDYAATTVLWVNFLIGLVTFGAILYAHTRYQRARWREYEEYINSKSNK